MTQIYKKSLSNPQPNLNTHHIHKSTLIVVRVDMNVTLHHKHLKQIGTVSANLKVVHIGTKHVHIGHVLVETTPKMG